MLGLAQAQAGPALVCNFKPSRWGKDMNKAAKFIYIRLNKGFCKRVMIQRQILIQTYFVQIYMA